MKRRQPKTTLRVDLQPRPSQAPGKRKGVLVVLSGSQPGRLLSVESVGIIVGRSEEEATVVLDDDSLSRKHARFFELQGGYYVEDLKSTNGTFVNAIRINSPVPLADGMRIQLGLATVLRFSLQDENEYEAARRLYDSSVRDPLTGLHNRYFFEERFDDEVAYARRNQFPLSVLFIDADHFKRVNDRFGHPAGDEVLRQLGSVLLDAIRGEDVAARIGGEEFVIVLRSTSADGALIAAERIRATVAAREILYEGQRIPVTVSIGVVTMTEQRSFETSRQLLSVADAALYQAKNAGRNCIRQG